MRQPNLLFLMSDQQRADTLAPGSPCQTPHLDVLTARGTAFNRCYAPNPICSPTRASLMTGLLPHNHGMVDCTHTVEPYRAELKSDLPFWSQALQAGGYHTGYFGKWHIERSNRLENFGFAEYELNNSPGYAAHRRALGLDERARRFVSRRAVAQPGYRDFTICGVVDEPIEATAEHYLYTRGIEFIERAAREPDQPWALFVSTLAPHDPYIVPQEHRARYNAADLPRPASFDDPLTDRPGIYRRIQRVWHDLDWDDFAEATACYYAFCSLVDDQVGRILAAVDAAGQLDNTIVIYTSDHGDYLGAHRLLLKGVPAFEEAYKVPLVLAGPGIAAGQRSDHIVSLLDLAATITPLTTSGDFPCFGRSLLPLLQPRDAPVAWEDQAFAECHGQRFFYTQRTIWRDQYKYVFNGFDEDECYDLAADPHECRNVASDPAYQEVVRDLAARMWAIIRATDDYNMHQAEYGMFRFAPVGPEAAQVQ
ncbi:MAG TPA: sulfatase-like hydrolase/transferase [Thermomicrobiales bacterium]|nr:sulfatase-like hydrolase/transferase [Thermomicrobiales bacterium]